MADRRSGSRPRLSRRAPFRGRAFRSPGRGGKSKVVISRCQCKYMEDAIPDLDRRFALPGVAQVLEGNRGMPKVRITSPEVVGEIYLHGAHVTSWKPAGREEVLFLSSQSRWDEGHAIRGGVPICFPWFGGKSDDPTAPAHGFVRTKAWQLESISRVGRAVTVSMFTEGDESTKRWWPADFRLVYRVTFGAELGLELLMSNTGRTTL